MLSFFCACCHEYYILFGTDFAKKKRAGMGFWFPKPALIFYADICMMAKESTPSLTGHSLVAMLNSKWIGVKVVSNQRLHHSRPLCHNAFLALGLHRREQFTVCSILPYHALLSHISHEIQNFFTHFAFILFYLVIVKCGKICGNTLKPQIGFVVCVHLIYYTHQYHPCQIETISKKKRGTFLSPSSFIQGTHRFPHGLGILA